MWWAIRLCKFLGLAMFAAGLHGALTQADASARRRAAFELVTPGFVVTWLAGYGLLKATGRSLAEPFVLVALLASLGSLHAALGAATRPSVRTSSRVAGWGGLMGTVGAMVVRDGDVFAWIGAALAATVATAVMLRVPVSDRADPSDPGPATWAWFRAVAWLEGTSLLFMLGVAMPARHLTGVSLDAGTGAVGWFHGTLVWVYLSGLFVCRRVLGWSGRETAAGFAAGLVPFGTFWFVRTRAAPRA